MTTPITQRLLTAAVAAGGLFGVLSSPAPANAAAQGSAVSSAVSANWAGYAVTGGSRPTSFNRVAGTWTQPAGTCSKGKETYSVTWVGLGGFKAGSKALEQTGTAVDCTPSGRAIYSAWYELVPAAPVTLELAVRPSDQIQASVAQKGAHTVLQVRDLSTGRSRTAVRRLTAPDTSSAEWIVEAPSLCFTSTHCTPLPLTDFGTVSFSDASVSTTNALRAAIDARTLKVTRLELRDYAQGPGRRFASTVTPATGIASALSAAGNAFTVTWEALSGEGEEGPPAAGQASQPPSITSAAASIRR
jgi:hypothetical protein